MARTREEVLTGRECQLMAVIWDEGEVTVEGLRDKLADNPAGSTVRTLLSILETKGYVRTWRRGRANIYAPVVPRERAQTDAVRSLAQRLFRGSAKGLISRLVEDEEISVEELDELREKLRAGRKAGE